MRAMWKGAVSFGLVNVPVKLYSATEDHDISFRQVHREDGGRIRYKRVCSVDGEEVSYDDIAKGYETDDGQMVVITDEDLSALPNQSSKEIAVEKFVPAEQIDPMLLDKSYYLEPEKGAAKAYALLRDALQSADRMALVTISIRTRMSMAVLRVRDGVIVLQTMLWPDEVRAAEFASLDDVSAASDRELAMANMLIESLSGDYEPEEFEDDYASAVETLVRTKLEGGEVKRQPVAKDGSGEVVDLLEALQRSVDKAKAARGEPVSSAPGKGRGGAVDDPGEAADPDGDETDTSREDLAPQDDGAATSTRKPAARKPAGRAAPTKAAPRKAPTKKATTAAAKSSAGAAKAPAKSAAKKKAS